MSEFPIDQEVKFETSVGMFAQGTIYAWFTTEDTKFYVLRYKISNSETAFVVRRKEQFKVVK